ncbi:hypothetical protein ACNQ23_25965, partial [Enterobacter cloacae complex sp.6730515]|uniref:hypothetical protein n=1 Tax=Enterobacter cloacae complex sp.6730515 TaxID=3397171 RepID=UPI003AB0A098
MEQSTLKEYSGSATEHMELIFSKQRANFEADPYPSLEARRTKLHQLCLLYTSPSPRDASTNLVSR